MGHDPRRQTTRPTTVRKGGRSVNVGSTTRGQRPIPVGAGGIPINAVSGVRRRRPGATFTSQERPGIRGGGAGLRINDLFFRPGEDEDELPPIDIFGDGGGGGGSFLNTQAGQAAANAFAAEQAQLDRDFALAEAEKARKFERDQEIDRLKAERERIFTDMLGTDPVRAVLFALGVGGEILPGGDRFADLEKLPGARAQADNTEEALGELLGRKVGVGGEGVTGLGTASQAAAAFGGQAGGAGGNVADQQKLLLSGFGVGAKRGKGRPGQSREETLRQIQSVTPQGVL